MHPSTPAARPPAHLSRAPAPTMGHGCWLTRLRVRPRARVTVEEILQLKQQEAERQKLKAKLSKQINANDLFDLE